MVLQLRRSVHGPIHHSTIASQFTPDTELVEVEGLQSVHRSVILFGLFHAATTAQLDVIFAEFNNRRDLREKKEQYEKDLHDRSLYYQPGVI